MRGALRPRTDRPRMFQPCIQYQYMVIGAEVNKTECMWGLVSADLDQAIEVTLHLLERERLTRLIGFI